MEEENRKIDGGATLWARQTIDSEIFVNKPDKWFKIWFYLVNRVYYKAQKGLKRGERYLKYEWIMDGTGATKAQIDHFIRWSKVNKMLATRKATHGMVVEVLKYSLFQDIDSYKSDTESETKATQKRQYTEVSRKKDNKEEDIVAKATESPPKEEKEPKINLPWQIMTWAEGEKGGKFVNTNKQLGIIKHLLKVGITPDEIKDRWDKLSNDSWYREKGLDFKVLSDNFDKKRYD